MADHRQPTRRTFLATTTLPLFAPALARVEALAYTPAQAPPPGRSFVTFDEPAFPIVDAGPPVPVPGARASASVAELIEALKPGAVLVWRHGSTFPLDAWTTILKFLEDGGSLLYVCGEPFTRPVTGAPGARRAEPRTVVHLKALRLNQAYRIDVGGSEIKWIGAGGGRPCSSASWVAALEPRFTDAPLVPDEEGSPGAREALLRPLAYAHRPGDDPRFPAAAVAYAIDRLYGRFSGGRWTLWLGSDGPTADEWTRLLNEAVRPPVDFRVDASFGCFHEGERPSIVLRAHRPDATDTLSVPCTISLDGPGSSGRTATIVLDVTAQGSASLALPGTFAPGLHRLTVDGGPLGRAVTGFWIFDEAFFASGDALTFDGYTLRRNGAPEPIVGTTTMSASVHRDFLFEPNAAVWDDTFAELTTSGLNAIRTGLWYGWDRASAGGLGADEAVLRALEAFYLTARRHCLPVIFNCFAFTPHAFGAADPYFDPAAIDGQRAFLAAIARRMAPAREFVWDLINEPSFASPKKLWSLRPAGTTFERDAFRDWLMKRDGDGWRDVARRRWRLQPDEPIDVPADVDFEDAYLTATRRPFRGLDYALFAQDAFERWVRDMTAAIREGGSAGAITVGQDEGGVVTRPNPLFHHAALDFTSMHTWWLNDALLWDGVLAKAGDTPLLVSETGIMQRERLTGEAVRDPAEFANLLSRKIGYAFAAGAFGVIQWCYETNPLMPSDNEVAIGLKRVDGSVKPEHRVLADAAMFVARNKARFDGYAEPDVALIVATGDQFSPRNTSTTAARVVVRAFYEDLGIPLRAVPDHRAARDLGRPRAIVLPACRGVSDAGWHAIVTAVEQGATLICSGWFEHDDAELPAERVGGRPRALQMVDEIAGLDGRVDVWRFPGTVPESWYAADAALPRRIPRGRGAIVHHPLPVEWAEPSPAVARFYRAALPRDLAPRVVLNGGRPPGLLLVTVPFRDTWLLVGINESSRDETVVARPTGSNARVTFDVPAARARLVFVEPRSWTILDLSA